MNRIGVALGAVAFLGGGGWVLAQMTAAPDPGLLPYEVAARVESGARLYAENCASCHGAQLEGERDWKERDADGYLPAPPHDQTGHTWHHPDAQLLEIVTHGTEALVGGSYKSNMIGYADILSEAEILDVLAYIKSTWPEEVVTLHNEINARTAVYD